MNKRTAKLGGLLLVLVGVILLIVFGMMKTSFEKQGAFLCKAISENPNVDMAQCPAHSSTIPTLISLGFVLSSLLLTMGVVILLLLRPTKSRKLSVDLTGLEEEEKAVCKLLVEHEGSMYQSDLIKKLEISKVRMTRILDHLEHDLHLIERKRRGMTNIVVLK